MGELLLAALIVVTTLIGVVRAPRVRGEPAGSGGGPGRWLLAVTAAIYLNQVLFTVYVRRVHHGDPAFIARYLPSGWFDLGALPDLFPAPELLSATVLRVPALLELPFVLLAYLTMCRWMGADAYRRAVRLVWPAAIAYTVVFCIIEIELANPYTLDDVLLRALSAVVTALAVTRWSAAVDGEVTTARQLLAFLASAGAVGYLVLVVYDTALLYNLGHVPAQLPGAAAAMLVLIVARYAARLPGRPAGPSTSAVIHTLSWFVAVFFVPALAIRYGLIFGAPVVAAAAGLITVAAAMVYGVRPVYSAALVLRLTLAAGTACAAALGAYLATRGYPEARVLCSAGAFLVAATLACMLLDAAQRRRVHEAG